MNFVDAIKAKFKKVDEAEINRLQQPVTTHKDDSIGEPLASNTPLGGVRPKRTGPSKSVTRLRAFIKQKTPEQLAAEDAARQLDREKYTEQAMDDIGRE